MDSKLIYSWFFFGTALLLSSCSTTEKIGNYRYKVKVHRVNTGDFGGIIETIKSYYLKNQFQAGCIIKSQLLYHEKKTDTVFSSGFTVIDNIGKGLKCYQFNYYWYGSEINNTYRYFLQSKDGELRLNEIRIIQEGMENLWEDKKLNQ